MRKLIRPFAAVVYIAFLAVSGILVSTGSAMTEDQVASPVKQMALTKKQIEGVLAAQKEMDEINEKTVGKGQAVSDSSRTARERGQKEWLCQL